MKYQKVIWRCAKGTFINCLSTAQWRECGKFVRIISEDGYNGTTNGNYLTRTAGVQIAYVICVHPLIQKALKAMWIRDYVRRSREKTRSDYLKILGNVKSFLFIFLVWNFNLLSLTACELYSMWFGNRNVISLWSLLLTYHLLWV